jgi:hypothetical protein
MENSLPLTLEKDSAKVVDTIHWSVPGAAKGDYRVKMLVRGEDGKTLSENDFAFIIS